MFNVLKLNEIAEVAGKIFNNDYSLTKQHDDPDAIILRSYNMHEYALKDNLLCVARAGAGTNNIPIDKCTAKGVVVFNTPGANANAVKELVLCALLLSSRKIVPAIQWTQGLADKGAEVAKLVESGKKDFIGPEIMGKTLGVVGLGAIGALVANAAVDLGMNVIGYDPFISVDAAWNISNHVTRETDFNELLRSCDYITLHIPLTPSTKNLFNKAAFATMKQSVAVVNCSRGELVNNDDIKQAIADGIVSRYVTDFPVEELIGNPAIITIPHLGASTPEAEDNCAVMAARQMIDFLENGNIHNSVNFPAVSSPRNGSYRITVIHQNVKAMLTKLTDIVSAAKINISNMLSKSQGEFAYTILDLDEAADKAILDKLSGLEGIVKVRAIS